MFFVQARLNFDMDASKKYVGAKIYFGTKYIYDSAGALWTCRFLGFTSGMFVFTILTWYYMNESVFTFKTMLCILLSAIILAIQIFMK